MSFSLCLLNWKRKNNTIRIVNNMVNFNCISDILISNGNSEHSVGINDFIKSDKIKIYDDLEINKEYGLDRRFINGLRAENDNVIIMDDDIEVSENELNKLIDEYKKNENRIVGGFGRKIGGRHGYHCTTYYDNVDVVLTKLLICKKKLFSLFFICKPLIEDVYKTGVPYGNGEDIFLNFISCIYFNNKGFCVKIEKTDLPELNCAVSGGRGHLKYRIMLCKYLIKNQTKFETFIKNLKI